MRKLLAKLNIYILNDTQLQAIRAEGVRAGKDIGILEVLRYNQQTLSPPKFKESAKHFDFESLTARYPNPVPHDEKAPVAPKSFTG